MYFLAQGVGDCQRRHGEQGFAVYFLAQEESLKHVREGMRSFAVNLLALIRTLDTEE